MTTHPDRVGTAQQVLDLWRAELSPLTHRWSLLLTSSHLEIAHDVAAAVPGHGAAAPLLARLAVDTGLPAGPRTELLDLCARAARPTAGDAAPALARALELLGGADEVNDRLRREGLASRFSPDGRSVLAPVEQAEVMAALAGNPAYAAVLPTFTTTAPTGLAAYLVADAALWHAQGAGERERHDGGVLVTPGGDEIAVHVHTDLLLAARTPLPPDLDDHVLAAVGRAMARTVALLGHPGLTLGA